MYKDFVLNYKMSDKYKKLVLDPRCLKPAHEVNNETIYLDATEAIDNAIAHPHATVSDKEVLETLKREVRANRFAMR